MCAHINTINILTRSRHILLLVPVSNELQSIKKFWRKYLKKYKSFSFGSLQFFHVSERVVLFDNSPKWQKNELEFNWNPEKRKRITSSSMQRQRPRTLNSATIWIDWQPYVGRQAAQFKRNTYQRPIIHAKMSVCVWRRLARYQQVKNEGSVRYDGSSPILCPLYTHMATENSPPPKKQFCV